MPRILPLEPRGTRRAAKASTQFIFPGAQKNSTDGRVEASVWGIEKHLQKVPSNSFLDPDWIRAPSETFF